MGRLVGECKMTWMGDVWSFPKDVVVIELEEEE